MEENLLKGRKKIPCFRCLTLRFESILIGGIGLAALFGEGFFRRMEAWAQDEVSVYIEDFGCNSFINADFPDLGKSIANNLRLDLRKMGINVKRTYNPNTDIVISGQADVLANHAKGAYINLKMGYEMKGKDTNGMGIQTELPMDYYQYVKDIANMVYRDVMGLKTRGLLEIQKRSEAPDEIMVQINGQWKKARKWKGVIGPGIREAIEENNQDALESLERDIGFTVRNKELYKITDDKQLPDEIVVQIDGQWRKARKYTGVLGSGAKEGIEKNDTGVIKSLQRDVGIIVINNEAYKIIE